MKKFTGYLDRNRLVVLAFIAVALGIAWLLLYRLGSLTGGLSGSEISAATMPVGWHGIYHQPFYLPLKLVRSVVFYLWPAHGQTLTRLPNALFGGLTIIAFVWLLRMWHSPRIALFGGLLFATGAWTLHAMRLASFDVLYLWAAPTLLLVNCLLQRSHEQLAVWYGSLIIWGLALYIPGLMWLIGFDIYLQRSALYAAWRHFRDWRLRALYVALALIWWPLLVINLFRPHNLIAWLGLPTQWPGLRHVVKQFIAVPVHLFVRGPENPVLWLNKAPVLDVFSLVVCLLGMYFYIRHYRASRSRLLIGWALVGWVLVAIGGPVGFSLLVPLLYVAAAAGLAYLLHEWMHTFPNNPLARSLGLLIVTLAVGLSCLYNLRAYFVAWPHNASTPAVFQYRR